RQVDREPERGVELERLPAGDVTLRRRVGEQFEPAVDVAVEADLLLLEDLGDPGGVAFQLGERAAHRLDDDRDERVDERLLEAEGLSAEERGAAEAAAQDITAPVPVRD